MDTRHNPSFTDFVFMSRLLMVFSTSFLSSSLHGKESKAAACVPQKRISPLVESDTFDGTLKGYTIFLDAGHGKTVQNKNWVWMRDPWNGIQEDIHNNEFVMDYLRTQLERAGARVMFSRAPSRQSVNCIFSMDTANENNLCEFWYSDNGWLPGKLNAASPQPTQKSLQYKYSADLKSEAVLTFRLARRGDYPVWVKFSAGVKPSSKVVYAIEHKGGTTNIVVDQSGTSNQWVLLGVFDFEERSKYSIRVRNAASSGNAIIERFRFGMGSLSGYKYNNIASGVPYWQEGTKPYLRDIGAPASVYAPCKEPTPKGQPKRCYNETGTGDDRDDLYNRALYAEWVQADAFISIHSNSDSTLTRGPSVMTYSQGPTACSLEMAQSVLSSITRLATDIYRIPLSKPNIVLRTNNPRTAMLRNLRSMPGFVVELAYHDHVDDAKLLKSTDFLKAAARAIYKGVAKHYAPSAPIAPLPPTQLAIEDMGGGNILVRWRPSIDSLEVNSMATQFKIFVKQPDGFFVQKASTPESSIQISGLQLNAKTVVKVRATNQGGESLDSNDVIINTSKETRSSLLASNIARQRLIEQLTRQQEPLRKFVKDVQNRFADPGKCQLVPGNDGMLHILLEGDILFDEAKADIKPIHEKFLNDLAALMKVNTELKFLIAGHTDPRPLKGKQRFRNNWELSAARSIAVAEFLIKRGVNQQNLGVAGYAENYPSPSQADHVNDRRIDIIVQPDLSALFPVLLPDLFKANMGKKNILTSPESAK